MKKLLFFFLIPLVLTSQTQIGNTIFGDNNEIGHHLGSAVSSSSNGSIIAVGSPHTSTVNGINSGIVRVYENIAGVWTQIGNDILGKADYNFLGNVLSLSLDGTTLAIGVRNNDDNALESGLVQVYQYLNGDWFQVGSDIKGQLKAGYLGHSVSLSSDGNILAFSSFEGKVFIYENIAGIWTQLGNLIEAELGQGRFGNNIKLSSNGSTIAIEYSSYGTNAIDVYDNISSTWTKRGNVIPGSYSYGILPTVPLKSMDLSSDGNTIAVFNRNSIVWIYRYSENKWSQVEEIVLDNLGEYGASISLSSDGKRVVIGDYGVDANEENSGQVKVYEELNGVWEQVGNSINGKNIGDLAGYSTSISSDGKFVTIGSPYNFDNGGNSGQVRVYEEINGTWTQVGADINGDLGVSADLYGTSISMSGNGERIAVGAPGYDSTKGLVRVFDLKGNSWEQVGNILLGENHYNRFGEVVSLSSNGNTLCVAEPGKDGEFINEGQVKVYTLNGDIWSQVGGEIKSEIVKGRIYDIELSANAEILAVSISSLGVNALNYGGVKVFKNIEGSWEQLGEDFAGDFSHVDFHHADISLSSDGTILAIGMPQYMANPRLNGRVEAYEYQSNNNTWNKIGDDIKNDERESLFGRGFGNSVSLSSDGDYIAVGQESFRSDDNNKYFGRVIIYKNESGIWVEVGQSINLDNRLSISGKNINIYKDGSMVLIRSNNSIIEIYKLISNQWTKIVDLSGETDHWQPDIKFAADKPIIGIGNPRNAGKVKVFNLEEVSAIGEVIDDIKGNGNGISITAAQLNAISGVSGALDGVDYSTALSNGTFADENNPTALEIQAVINTVNSTLSIESSTNLNAFRIYPNPTHNFLNLGLPENLILNKVNIYNALGQSVKSSTKLKVDVSKLSKGLYSVEIETNRGKAVKKVIIE